MEIDTMIGLGFIVFVVGVLCFAVTGLLQHYLIADVVDNVEYETPDHDETRYTAAFENYWLWEAKNTGIPNIFLSDRVKPVAFAAWQAAFWHVKKEVLK